MDLKGKGMVSMMDAMLFITVLGIAASVIFVHIPHEPQGTSAKEVHDELFRTEMKVSDVFDVADTRIMPLQDLLAAYLTSGNGNISEYIRDVLEKKTGRPFIFVSSCGDGTLKIDTTASDAGVPQSFHSAVMETPYGMMDVSLSVF